MYVTYALLDRAKAYESYLKGSSSSCTQSVIDACTEGKGKKKERRNCLAEETRREEGKKELMDGGNKS